MADEHFSHEVIERFFRSELSRGESRDLVRHLLRQCSRCSRLVREIARGQRLHVLVRGHESTASRFDPGSRPQILEQVLRLVGRGEARAVRVKRAARAGLR
jgi:hypothetical protein